MENQTKGKSNIYILGDICPGWNDTQQFATGNMEAVFLGAHELFQSGDLVIGNLECPVTNSSAKIKKTGCNIKCNAKDINVLADLGISALSLANNHILDYGEQGLKDTLDCLNQYKIKHYGAGTIKESQTPYSIELSGKKIQVLSFAEREFNCAVDYSVGANLWDDIDSLNLIRSRKETCDYLIVQYHGGIEFYEYPSPQLQKRCRAMAEAGADFITCQHSHCIGTHEHWGESEILYGQGNTLFGYDAMPKCNEGLIVHVTFGEKMIIKYIPIIATINGEQFMDNAMAAKCLTEFEERSSQLNNPLFLNEKWKEFCALQKDMYLPMLYARSRVFNKLNRIFKGVLIDMNVRNNSQMATMNLVRCDAHREVVQTLLEQEYCRDE